jgi:hypothetical protein
VEGPAAAAVPAAVEGPAAAAVPAPVEEPPPAAVPAAVEAVVEDTAMLHELNISTCSFQSSF